MYKFCGQYPVIKIMSITKYVCLILISNIVSFNYSLKVDQFLFFSVLLTNIYTTVKEMENSSYIT